MSSSTNKKGQPSRDPYDVLSVSFGASNAEITKAYRKLALQLHPDKQKQGLSQIEQEEVAKRFHDIKEARSFLLDVEHAEDRRVYDAKRESERIRRETEAVRERQMSDRRKRMRDELKEKEALARQQSAHKRKKQQEDKDLVDRLRKEGQARREAKANQEAEKELERQLRKERKEREASKEERQVRLKWDRKKLKISHSEDSIASLLSRFGFVESVELLGKKGNQALVTFQDASSCRPCVDAYATSKEMRAKFVGHRKDREEDDEQDETEEIPKHPAASKTRDVETLEERRLRQAAEREALLREMQDDSDGEPSKMDDGGQSDEKKTSRKRHREGISKPFPLPFPDDDRLNGLTPFAKLAKLEEEILGDFLTSDQLHALTRTQ